LLAFIILATRSPISVGRSPRNFAPRRQVIGFSNFGPKFRAFRKKFYWSKTCKIWSDLGRLQNSTANVSKTNKDVQNQQVFDLPRFLSRSTKKVRWTLVH